MTSSDPVRFKRGQHYEERLVQALVTDHKFAEQILEVLDVEYFELEYLRELTTRFFEYYTKYTAFPSFPLLENIIQKEMPEAVAKTKILTYFKEIKREPLNGDIEYIKDTALDFCQKRRVVLSLEKVLEFAETKNYNEIVPEIQKALQAGSERDMGHEFVNDFESRMQRAAYNPIPTGWENLNKIIKGGLGGGKLAAICAPTGVGKSHALVDIGAAAIQAGFNVAHYTLELSEADTGNRYDARVSGIGIDNLIEHKDFVKQTVRSVKGQLIIKSYPTKSASVATLRNHYHKMLMKGFKPDVIIIDYADLMKSRREHESKRFEEESIYEELRAWAMELTIPIWTATQTNREGLDVEVITLKHIAECFAKAMICDLFITLNRKKDSEYCNLGNMFVAKSRMGPDGIKFPMLINTSTSKIELLPPGTGEDDEGSGDDSPGGMNRLKKKYKEFLKSSERTTTTTQGKAN